MSNTNWKEEIEQLIQNEKCTDSDVEEFIHNHPNLNGKKVWNYIAEFTAPTVCKGCIHIQMSGMYPCSICIRQNLLKDFYESK